MKSITVIAGNPERDIRRRRTVLVSAIGALLIVYAVGAYGGLLQGKWLSWWSDLFWTLAAFGAGWRSHRTARTRAMEHERKAWNLFALAALSWFAGMLIWDYHEIFGATLVPFPSIGDWFFMGYAVLFSAGLLYYRTQRPTRQYNMVQIANLGLIVCTIIVLGFIALSQALERSPNTIEYELYALAHAILTIVCFVFGVYCYWFYVWRENRHSFRLMLVALLVFAVTDTLYAFQLLGQNFEASSYLNIYWLIALALQYWAAFEQDHVTGIPARETDSGGIPRAQRYEAIMPALCLLVVLAYAIYAKEQINDTTLTVMTIAAVVYSVFLTLREWYSNSLEIALRNDVQNANQQLESRVRQRTAQLSHANRELESFSYSVSHDLRAPLRAIDGYSYILQEEYTAIVDESGRAYLRRIRHGVQKMGALIDDLLALSRVSRYAINRQDLNLSELAAGIIEHLRERDPAREVNITIAENVFVRGDEQLLRVALQNLLGNAWKFTGKTAHARIEFGAIRHNPETVYFIKDNGAGFDMRHGEKLFEAFQRLHGDEFEGTGIGLATVQRCIQRQGGRIWAEAEVDGGATFYFTLPAESSEGGTGYV